MTDTMPQPGDGPDYHNDLSAWKVREFKAGFEAGATIQGIIRDIEEYGLDTDPREVEAYILPYLREELYSLGQGHEFFVMGFVGKEKTTARIQILKR